MSVLIFTNNFAVSIKSFNPLESIRINGYKYKVDCPHSVPNDMESQTWNFFRLPRKIQIHQQTKGLILIFYYQFNQVVVIKSEEITNISSKFNKNTVQSANPLDLILKIT